ncbi:MAG: HDOD domain-containing protein [Gallionella sp.]|nr:HDOD domain-containing protein [Gallionella sp.]
MSELSPELTGKLSSAVEKMPAFPKSVQRVLELTRDINCSPKELVEVIEKDPVMTMKLLRALNSAYYSFPRQITSVNQSVVYLGLNTVKNMALSFAAIGALPENNAAGFDMQRYLMHSLLTASLARMVCQKFQVEEADSGDCYLTGLLHDFGKVVFAQFMPQEFRLALDKSARENISLQQAELETIGADHTLVGAMLVDRWQFPSDISSHIRNHHQASERDGVQNCVFIADQISKTLLPGASGNSVVYDLPDFLMSRFGGDLDSIIAQLGGTDKLVQEAELYARVNRGEDE